MPDPPDPPPILSTSYTSLAAAQAAAADAADAAADAAEGLVAVLSTGDPDGSAAAGVGRAVERVYAAAGDAQAALLPAAAAHARPAGFASDVAAERALADAAGLQARVAGEHLAGAGVAAYGDPTYWEGRFADEDEYEWCGAWDGALADTVAPALANARRVLILGAGTSRLPFALAAEGGGRPGGRLPALREVVATDISPTAVAKLRARVEEQAGGTPPTSSAPNSGGSTQTVAITAAVADMTDLATFPDASFDAVLEKGTFDVLEVAGPDGRAPDPWNPPPEVRGRMHAALGEAHRVLRPDGGVLVSITWASPLFRRGHYLDDARYDWGGPDRVVEGGSVGGAVPVVVYLLTRGGRAAGTAWRRPAPGQVCGGGGGQGREGLPTAPAHAQMDDEDYLLRVGLGDE